MDSSAAKRPTDIEPSPSMSFSGAMAFTTRRALMRVGSGMSTRSPLTLSFSLIERTLFKISFTGVSAGKRSSWTRMPIFFPACTVAAK